jgi:hypothetical protein
MKITTTARVVVAFWVGFIISLFSYLAWAIWATK